MAVVNNIPSAVFNTVAIHPRQNAAQPCTYIPIPRWQATVRLQLLIEPLQPETTVIKSAPPHHQHQPCHQQPKTPQKVRHRLWSHTHPKALRGVRTTALWRTTTTQLVKWCRTSWSTAWRRETSDQETFPPATAVMYCMQYGRCILRLGKGRTDCLKTGLQLLRGASWITAEHVP